MCCCLVVVLFRCFVVVLLFCCVVVFGALLPVVCWFAAELFFFVNVLWLRWSAGLLVRCLVFVVLSVCWFVGVLC